MSVSSSRRQFLTTAAGTTLLGLGDLSALAGLRPVNAAEARLDPNLVRLQPDIEPLVHFIEETPRGRLIEETAARIRGGLPSRNLLAALLVAGAIRDLQATILHLLGLDPFKFGYQFQGHNNRLIGPSDEARVIHDILA